MKRNSEISGIKEKKLTLSSYCRGSISIVRRQTLKYIPIITVCFSVPNFRWIGRKEQLFSTNWNYSFWWRPGCEFDKKLKQRKRLRNCPFWYKGLSSLLEKRHMWNLELSSRLLINFEITTMVRLFFLKKNIKNTNKFKINY